MEGLARTERIRQFDAFKQEYDNANTALTIQCMALALHHARPEQLRAVVSAAGKLAELCSHELSDIEPLDVMFWLRKRLLHEARKPERDAVYIATCKRERRYIEQQIADICAERGHLTPLAVTS